MSAVVLQRGREVTAWEGHQHEVLEKKSFHEKVIRWAQYGNEEAVVMGDFPTAFSTIIISC